MFEITMVLLLTLTSVGLLAMGLKYVDEHNNKHFIKTTNNKKNEIIKDFKLVYKDEAFELLELVKIHRIKLSTIMKHIYSSEELYDVLNALFEKVRKMKSSENHFYILEGVQMRISDNRGFEKLCHNTDVQYVINEATGYIDAKSDKPFKIGHILQDSLDDNMDMNLTPEQLDMVQRLRLRKTMFSDSQLKVIDEGRKLGLDVTKYANANYDYKKMMAIMNMLKDGYEVNFNTDYFDTRQIGIIRRAMSHRINIAPYIKGHYGCNVIEYILDCIRNDDIIKMMHERGNVRRVKEMVNEKYKIIYGTLLFV